MGDLNVLGRIKGGSSAIYDKLFTYLDERSAISANCTWAKWYPLLEIDAGNSRASMKAV
jgi:hypothetical protein